MADQSSGIPWRPLLTAVALTALLATLAFLSFRSARTGAQSAAVQPPAQAPDLSGVWVGSRIQTYNPSDPHGSKLDDGTPYSPWALAKMKSEKPGYGPKASFETDDPALVYNDPDGYPRVLVHPFKFKFVQTQDAIYMLFQYQQNWRAIAMNREHPADPDPSWFGDATGRWEGDALVVDSIGFNDRTWLDPIGQPHTEALHLVEHFRRLDHNTLRDDIIFDDPQAYTKPWSGQLTFTLDPTGRMDEGFSTLSDELRFRNDVITPSRAKPPQK